MLVGSNVLVGISSTDTGFIGSLCIWKELSILKSLSIKSHPIRLILLCLAGGYLQIGVPSSSVKTMAEAGRSITMVSLRGIGVMSASVGSLAFFFVHGFTLRNFTGVVSLYGSGGLRSAFLQASRHESMIDSGLL